jgi:hypothetical protein
MALTYNVELERWDGSAWVAADSDTGVADTFYDWTGLTASTLYRWRVQAEENSLTGDWSDWLEATTLAAFFFSVAPTVTARTSSQYTLSGTLSELGDVYAVATLDTDTDPDEAQIVDGKNGDDGAALGVGSAHDVTEFSFAVTGANLADQLTHDLHVVGRRNA